MLKRELIERERERERERKRSKREREREIREVLSQICTCY